MSSPLSRLEIEAAVAGNNKPSKRQQSPASIDDTEFESPRRQNVIGGTLSGISQSRRFRLVRRFSDSNIFIWVGGAVTLLILMAFLWPQKESAITEVAKTLDENRVIALDDTASTEASTGKASFTRFTDKARADEYRAEDKIDQKVDALLDKADQLLQVRKFTQPRSENATIIYKQVLELRPANNRALSNLEKIRKHYEFRGVSALNEDNLEVAKENLRKMTYVDADSQEYNNLASDIQSYTVDQQVKSLIGKARTAIEGNKLVDPEQDNAIYYLQQALKFRPNNQDASAGIQQVSDLIVDQANNEILAGRLDRSRFLLNKVQEVNPDHQSIPLLEAMFVQASNPPDPQSSQLSQKNVAEPEANTPLASNLEELSSSENANASSSQKTPTRQANEQALFDEQYLREGLASFYSDDYVKANALLAPLADKGIARAQIKLGYMQFFGLGSAANPQRALSIIQAALPALRKFANEGRAWAQSDLGDLYKEGIVLPKDISEALYWYRSAADNGYSAAQTQLGDMYQTGIGVTRNTATAQQWYQRAATQGNERARQKLFALQKSSQQRNN